MPRSRQAPGGRAATDTARGRRGGADDLAVARRWRRTRRCRARRRRASGPARAGPRAQHSAAQVVGDRRGRRARRARRGPEAGTASDGTVRPVPPPPARPSTVDAAPDRATRRRRGAGGGRRRGEAARRGDRCPSTCGSGAWPLVPAPARRGRRRRAGRPSSPRGPPTRTTPPGSLGAALETATDEGRRRAQGLHVTPALAGGRPGGPRPARRAGRPARAVGRPDRVRPRLRRRRVPRGRRPAGSTPRGLDRRTTSCATCCGAPTSIPVGLAAAEAALALWAGEAPPPGRLVVGDPLRDGAGAVARAAGRRVRRGGRQPAVPEPARPRPRPAATPTAGACGPATATSCGPTPTRPGCSSCSGCDLVRPGGRVVLVQPQSVVAARDAAAVAGRRRRAADLHDLWLDDGRVFAAAVRVCAPVLVRRPDAGDAAPAAGPLRRVTRAWARRALPVVLPDLRRGPEHAGGAGWRRRRLPRPVLRPGRHRPRTRRACRRGRARSRRSSRAALVDWAGCAWGDRPVRYARRRWDGAGRRPRPPRRAPRRWRQRWVARHRAPKLVVATPDAAWSRPRSTPAGAGFPRCRRWRVVPHDPDDLWRLAAAVLRRRPPPRGWPTGRRARRSTARALRWRSPTWPRCPCPATPTAWDAAAPAARGRTPPRPGPRPARPVPRGRRRPAYGTHGPRSPAGGGRGRGTAVRGAAAGALA